VATKQELTNAVWQAATAIRNEHRDVKKYIEYTAMLLFFKFYDDVYTTLPADIQGLIPEPYRWRALKRLDPRGFDAYHPDVRNRLRDFFDNKRWREQAAGHFGVIFENFIFDIKHDEVLGRALRQLDKIDFATIDYDAKGAIYEFLIARMSEAGVKGEFFTPRPVVNMIIAVLKPRFGMRVWDPAAGTGGFLARAWEEMLADLRARCPDEHSDAFREGLRRLREASIFGNETEAVSARLARMNMILKGDGHSAVMEFNSLDQQTYSLPTLTLRDDVLKNPYPTILAEGGFDMIIANPPYGGSQAVSDLSECFKPWNRTAKPESNFLQLMMHALKPGGVCGVLMPEGVLFRAAEAPIRRRLLREFDLQAVVGLFKGVFEFADVKACVLFFRKPEKDEHWAGTQRVWMAEPRSFNHIEELAFHWRSPDDSDYYRFITLDEINVHSGNLRPVRYLNTGLQTSEYESTPLADVLKPHTSTFTLDDDTEYRRISVSLYGKGVSLRDTIWGRELKTKRQRTVKAGQVVMSNIWARKQAFGIVPDDLEGAIASTDFSLFDINSEEIDLRFLGYILGLGPLAEDLESMSRGSTGKARVHSDDFLSLEIPGVPKSEQVQFVERLDRQRRIAEECERLLEDVDKLDWLDDSLFKVSQADLLATSFAPLVEDATDYIDPTEQPETLWKVYGVSNEEGVRLGQTKVGAEFKAGRKYKRLIEDALAYNPQRVNVGSVGFVEGTDAQSIISPYYVTFTCKPELDRRFAFFLIKSPYFRRLIDETAVGAVRHELFFSLFVNIPVSIPQPAVQRQIVARIEAQLDTYNGVRLLKEQTEATMRQIVRGLFNLAEEE
jgi:type I restriction enzyme M protein